MNGLSDTNQALLMLVAFVLVPVGTWAGLGFPTDKMALGTLTSSIIAGIILFIKEYAGTPVPSQPPAKPGP